LERQRERRDKENEEIGRRKNIRRREKRREGECQEEGSDEEQDYTWRRYRE
jgi:hypothetical protein